MGCDIHLYGERKTSAKKWFEFWKKPAKWITIDKWTPNPDYPQWDRNPLEIKRDDLIYSDGRNYNLFCALAHVRSWEFANETTCISEPKGMPEDACLETVAAADMYGSDGHSHSYLTLSEIEAFDFTPYGKTCNRFLDEVLPKLRAYNCNPDDIRIVFFFDN